MCSSAQIFRDEINRRLSFSRKTAVLLSIGSHHLSGRKTSAKGRSLQRKQRPSIPPIPPRNAQNMICRFMESLEHLPFSNPTASINHGALPLTAPAPVAPGPHDRRAAITSRASKSAWTTQLGKCCQRLSRNTGLTTITGRTMPCSFAMAHPVRRRAENPAFIFMIYLGNRIERCLSYDEKPLLLFQKLKDSKKNPVFMLKHIKDIRSPIAVAQQKHAARKASSVISQDTLATSGHQKTGSTSRNAGGLTVHDPTASTPTLLTPSPNPGWPDGGALSPAVDGHDPGAAPMSAITTSHSSASMSASGNGREDTSNPYRRNESNEPSSHSREAPASTGLSYAVAIYPYMAEQDDEFDVVVYVLCCPLWLLTKCFIGEIHSLFFLVPVDGGWSSGTQQVPAS